MAEPCAVIGVGQTQHDTKRIDVSQVGLVREAAQRALEDAELDWKDIDAVVIGKAPDLFEGVMMPELFLAEALGGAGKPMLRVHTAGSVGGSTAVVAASLIQAGVHQRVLTVAYEKQSESNAMWALSIRVPFQQGVVAGAGGYFAPLIRAYIRRSNAPDDIGHPGGAQGPAERAQESLRAPQHAGITFEQIENRRCCGIRSATSRPVRPRTAPARWCWRAQPPPGARRASPPGCTPPRCARSPPCSRAGTR